MCLCRNHCLFLQRNISFLKLIFKKKKHFSSLNDFPTLLHLRENTVQESTLLMPHLLGCKAAQYHLTLKTVICHVTPLHVSKVDVTGKAALFWKQLSYWKMLALLFIVHNSSRYSDLDIGQCGMLFIGSVIHYTST